MPITPNDNDVLFGRGHTIACHPGNAALRARVEAVKADFLAVKKNKLKRQMAEDIVADVKRRGGRFLIEDPQDGGGGKNGDGGSEKPLGIYDRAWAAVGHEKAINKVLHRLREKGAKEPGESRKKRAKGSGAGEGKPRKKRKIRGGDGAGGVAEGGVVGQQPLAPVGGGAPNAGSLPLELLAGLAPNAQPALGLGALPLGIVGAGGVSALDLLLAGNLTGATGTNALGLGTASLGGVPAQQSLAAAALGLGVPQQPLVLQSLGNSALGLSQPAAAGLLDLQQLLSSNVPGASQPAAAGLSDLQRLLGGNALGASQPAAGLSDLQRLLGGNNGIGSNPLVGGNVLQSTMGLGQPVPATAAARVASSSALEALLLANLMQNGGNNLATTAGTTPVAVGGQNLASLAALLQNATGPQAVANAMQPPPSPAPADKDDYRRPRGVDRRLRVATKMPVGPCTAFVLGLFFGCLELVLALGAVGTDDFLC
ncbi:hypothetical protein ACHAXT_002598 [Thalassiosira profunda]